MRCTCWFESILVGSSSRSSRAAPQEGAPLRRRTEGTARARAPARPRAGQRPDSGRRRAGGRDRGGRRGVDARRRPSAPRSVRRGGDVPRGDVDRRDALERRSRRPARLRELRGRDRAGGPGRAVEPLRRLQLPGDLEVHRLRLHVDGADQHRSRGRGRPATQRAASRSLPDLRAARRSSTRPGSGEAALGSGGRPTVGRASTSYVIGPAGLPPGRTRKPSTRTTGRTS